MVFLATHIFVWLLVAFAFGLGIGWFLWGQWVGIDMNRDFKASTAGADTPSGSISVLSDSLLKTQRELELCQQSLVEAQSRMNETDMRFTSKDKSDNSPAIELPGADETDVDFANADFGGDRFEEEDYDEEGFDEDNEENFGFEDGELSESGTNSNTDVEVRDDLKKIYGIGPVIERKLGELEITTYRQIAMLSEADKEVVGEYINYFSGRIDRDRWLESARELHKDKYGEEI
ncbi:MAG: hypothetical protein AB8G77_13470 [Rhodothermales bacterium]